MIEFKEVSYRYPQAAVDALSAVGLATEGGEMLLVTGRSGSGKSTLLRAMNGLIPHFHGGSFSGSVCIDGLSTIDTQPRDLVDRVGFLGQDAEDHAVVDRVEDDIAFTLENLGVPPNTMRKRVEEVLDALSIAHLRRRRLDTLSGGERQRVAIAGALIAMPQHIVLDEPTSQLDPQSSEEVLASILRLRDEIGITIVLAEQRLERVVQYADRMCVVSEGVVTAGDVRQICGSFDVGSPIIRLAKAVGWSPLPLTLREARGFARSEVIDPRSSNQAASSGHAASSGEDLLRVSGLSLKLGGLQVLRDIELEGAQGEVLAIMGRNGSGKTSLLRAISGLVSGSAGSVSAPGSIAYVPQNPESILFRRTVADEIRATLRARKRDASHSGILAEAHRFGVESLLERYPRDLSGGQKTKAALAAATAGSPDLVLLDEPTRGMDQVSKDHLADLIMAWRAEGKLVILATHDVELAALVATRVILLAEGNIVMDAPPQSALAESITFSTQMNKVFRDPRILTLDDALKATGQKVI